MSRAIHVVPRAGRPLHAEAARRGGALLALWQVGTGLCVRVAVLLAAFVLTGARFCAAGLAPENVVVVVNGDSWVSRSVANHYVRRRLIPAINVIVLTGIESHEGIDIEGFRESILKPVLAAIEQRRLNRHVSCVAYAPDFPTWVDFSDDIGSRKVPDLVGSRGSITGLTFLYQDVLARNLEYVRLDSNWYARRPRLDYEGMPAFTAEEAKAYAKVREFLIEKDKRAPSGGAESDAWLREGWVRSMAILTTLNEAHPGVSELIYNTACAQAASGLPAAAVETLAGIAPDGYRYYQHVVGDTDLEPLRDREDFKALVARFRDCPPDMVPPMPFSAAHGWTPRGQSVPIYKGARYLLSVMLGVTSGRGNSYDDVIQGIDRAADADGTHPDGTVYLMTNADVRSTCRDWAFRGAQADVRAHGVRAEIMPGILPQACQDVAGLMAGTATFDWAGSGSRILPGALCEHLTSYGGMLGEGDGQTPLTEFIRYGAAGASGTVCEPRASQAKFPTAFIQSYYTAGYSLAEAFFLAVTGPYQLLIVGDPLCAPWARPGQLRIAGVDAGSYVETERLSVKLAGIDGIAEPVDGDAAWFVDGRLFAATRGSAPVECDVSRLGAGWHDLSVLAPAGDAAGTMSRQAVSFAVGPPQPGFRLVDVPLPKVRWGESLVVRRLGKAVGPLTLIWLGRDVARLNDEEQETRIASESLAIGTVRLVPILKTAADKLVMGAPIEVDIEPPAPVVLAPLGVVQSMPEGIEVMAGGRRAMIAEKATGTWLQDAGVVRGDAVVLDTWFSVQERALAQFQFRGNLPLAGAVLVDGVTQAVPEQKAGWRSFPITLEAGTHRLTVQTLGVDTPKLDIRYGVRGSRVLDGRVFRHK